MSTVTNNEHTIDLVHEEAEQGVVSDTSASRSTPRPNDADNVLEDPSAMPSPNSKTEGDFAEGEGGIQLAEPSTSVYVHETSCFVDQLMPESANIRLPKDAPPHIRSYMCSTLIERAISLWKPISTRSLPPGLKFRDAVGNVGFLTREGGFETQFNFFLSFEENKLCGYNPPRCFKPLDLHTSSGDVSTTMPIVNNDDKGRQVLRLSGRFRSKKQKSDTKWVLPPRLYSSKRGPQKHGSALVLPQGYISYDLIDSLTFSNSIQDYFNKYAARWYAELNEARSPKNRLENGSLIYISGSYMASRWAVASFCQEPKWEAMGFWANLHWDESSHSYCWRHHDLVKAQTSPTETERQDEEKRKPPFDQVVAIHAFSICTGNRPSKHASPGATVKTWISSVASFFTPK